METNVNEACTLSPAAIAAALGEVLGSTSGNVNKWNTAQVDVIPGLTIQWNGIAGTPTVAGDFNVKLQEVNFALDVVRTIPFVLTVVGPHAPEPEPVDPAVQTVADFLGRGDDPSTLEAATQTLPIVTAMAKAYTRGKGFTDGTPSSDIAAVITTATARLMFNPEGIAHDVGSVSIRGSFTGWTLAELYVLNAYRVRAI